jgi:phytoene dehydrogenase-like protein
MIPSAAMMPQLARIAMKGPAATFALARLAADSVRQFVDRSFHSTEAKGLFTPWAFHLDYGPDIRGGAMFAFVAAMTLPI